jgi:hypothetical protein
MPKTNSTTATLRSEKLPQPEKVKDAKSAPAGTASKIAGSNRNGNPKLQEKS